nr:uncharacterized protein LOC113823926 [Penaeus vannamei]
MGSQGWTSLLLLLATAAVMAGATKVEYAVECSADAMVVRVPSAGVASVELDKWGELPGCAPVLEDAHWTLTLPLDDALPCGTTRVRNKITVRSALDAPVVGVAKDLLEGLEQDLQGSPSA